METIQQKANKYQEEIVPHFTGLGGATFVKNAYIAGVKEAIRWIPVEESFPDNQDTVLVKTDKGCVLTACLHSDGFITIYGKSDSKDFGNIICWRPIEFE